MVSREISRRSISVEVLNFLVDLVEGALAPFTFGTYSWIFQVDVFGKLTDAKGKITETVSLAADNSAFPGGSWPKAVTPGSEGVMNDGTVADGDADWSVPRR